MIDPSDTNEELIDDLLAQYIEHCREGSAPDWKTYVGQHPEHADTISELFPMIAALESMKLSGHRETARTATQLPLDLRELGDFEIIREIGRGGMGIVYEARQRTLGRRVALKVLPKQSLLDPAQLKRFKREARIVARLHHTNVVSLFGAGEHQGYHFLAMELVSGQSIANLIKLLNDGPESQAAQAAIPDSVKRYGTQRYWRSVARIGHNAALGLQHAHDRNVLHRDLTPSNLLLDNHGNVMLTDFGMAKMMSTAEGTRTQSFGGTLGYVPPESFSGQFDERSDIFGIGSVLYELLTLKPAFDDASPAEAIKRVADNLFRPTPPSTVNAAIPRDLETIVLKTIAEQPSQRYASAKQLADDLQRFLELRPIKARRSSALEHTWRFCQRNRAIAAMTTLAVFSLVGVSIAMTYSFIQAQSATKTVKSALAREMKQRERSDETLDVATNVLNNIYEELVPTDLQSFDTPASDLDSQDDRAALPVLSDEMVSVLDKLLEFYDQLADRGGDNQALLLSSATALGRVADIYCQLGQPAKALDYYTSAVTKIEELETIFPDDTDSKIQHARLYNDIGRLHHIDERLDESISSHRKALTILKKAEKSEPELTPKLLYEMARAHYFMGKQKIRDASAIVMRRLVERKRRPRRATPSRQGPAPEGPPGFRPGRPPIDTRPGEPRRPDDGPPPSFNMFGWISEPLVRPQNQPAREFRHAHLVKAIETLERLSDEDQRRPEHEFLLACCYREFFEPSDLVDRTEVDRYAERAGKLLSDLVARYSNNAHYRYELAESLRLYERLIPERGLDGTHAIASLDSALHHADTLVTQHPNVPQYAVTRMHILHRKGHVLMDQAQEQKGKERDKLFASSLVYIKQTLAQADILVARWPNRLSHRIWYIVVRGSLGKALLELGNKEEAAEVLNAALESIHELEPLAIKAPQTRRQLPAVRNAIEALVKRARR